MIKKIILILILLAMAVVFAISLYARKAPELLRQALENALGKPVSIRTIEYRFPGTFELEGFEIKENAPFSGETAFSVDYVKLDVSPLSWSKKRLIIDRLEVEDADVIVRKWHGRLVHALSSALRKAPAAADRPEAGVPATGAVGPWPLEIHTFEIKNTNFQFVDFDAQEGGFVIVVDQIRGQVKDIELPFTTDRTTYRLSARLLQGRDQRPAEFSVNGWTVFATRDSDANFVLTGVFLPYFKPYYAQVTGSVIESGYVNARANVNIQRNDLVLNVDLEIINLLFGSYEDGNQLFGLKADELLSFLKEATGGRLKIQFSARWNLADRTVTARDVIRRSIERSLKDTVLGNVGNILQNVIKKVGEEGVGTGKDGVEGTLKKLKDLIKF